MYAGARGGVEPPWTDLQSSAQRDPKSIGPLSCSDRSGLAPSWSRCTHCAFDRCAPGIATSKCGHERQHPLLGGGPRSAGS